MAATAATMPVGPPTGSKITVTQPWQTIHADASVTATSLPLDPDSTSLNSALRRITLDHSDSASILAMRLKWALGGGTLDTAPVVVVCGEINGEWRALHTLGGDTWQHTLESTAILEYGGYKRGRLTKLDLAGATEIVAICTTAGVISGGSGDELIIEAYRYGPA